MQPLRELLAEVWEADWQPLPLWAAGGWILFYLLFLWTAFRGTGALLLIDNVNLVVHEGGHLLFGWFGQTLGVWGGTILQCLVPFLLAVFFLVQRQPQGFAFCSFFFFENWLGIGTYMADARAMVLPLVTTGDPELAEHEWHKIFSSLGLLQYDTRIGGTVRFLGFSGMIAVMLWVAWRAYQDRTVQIAS
jgi:hypothetical protein